MKRIDDYYSTDHDFCGKGKIEAILPQSNRSRIIIKLYDDEVRQGAQCHRSVCDERSESLKGWVRF